MDATWVDHLLQPGPHRSRPFFSAQEGMRMVALPQADVRCRVVGQGPQTIVFVADAPITIEHYDTLLGLLAPAARAVCFESPGMGFSRPRRGFRFTLDEQAQVAADLLTALGVTRATLAFSCVGAYLGLRLAAARPDLVERLILLQAPSWDEEARYTRRMDFRGKGLLARPLLGQVLMAAAKRKVASRWFAKAVSSPHGPAFTACSHAAYDAGAGFALASLIQAYFGSPPPRFAPIHQPTLVVWGESDGTHRETDRRSLLTHVPHARWVSFPTAGHCPELEEPHRFCSLALAFMSGEAIPERAVAEG